MNKSVDIVTINFNSGSYLPDYFEALRGLDYPLASWRVILVDNGSSDGSMERLPEITHGIELATISLGRNGGVTAGNNAGITAGNSEYVSFLNPDTRVHKDWLSRLVDHMEAETDIGLAEAAQVPSELDKYRDPDTGDTSWASTGGVLVRRSALNQAGTFDERFFMYEDDVDLCWRLWLHGWRCVYVPEAKYDHRPHDTRPPSSFLRYHVVRNQAYMRFIYGSNGDYLSRIWLGLKFAARDTSPDLRSASVRAAKDAIAALPWLRQRRNDLPPVRSKWVGLFEDPYMPSLADGK